MNIKLCIAVYIQANLEDDIVKEALKTVSHHFKIKWLSLMLNAHEFLHKFCRRHSS